MQAQCQAWGWAGLADCHSGCETGSQCTSRDNWVGQLKVSGVVFFASTLLTFPPRGHCCIWKYLGLAQMGWRYRWHLLDRGRDVANVLQCLGWPPTTQTHPLQNANRPIERRPPREDSVPEKMTHKKTNSAPSKIKYLPSWSHAGKQVSISGYMGGFAVCLAGFLAEARCIMDG